MSKQIENNVVQMTFDNKDFERNISQSSKSIDNLNEQLKFKDASKGFQDIEKYANSVNFSGLSKAIENINSVFTVTGNLSKRIIDDIAGYFENKIVSTVNTVKGTIGYIMDVNLGVNKYEQYTTAMNTLKANMTTVDKFNYDALKKDGQVDTELEYLETHMERILTFTDETSYSFTDMVDTIAKFASSDVDLARAGSAIMGMANVAAVAGQNATTATMSMQQLAQAFGTGYVKYEDWKQAFTSKNMVTKELKQTLVDAALGVTLDEKDIAQAKAQFGDENYADFFFTSEMLGKKWLDTSEVLVKGLSEYSKASDYILENMESISEDASVTDMLTWIEDFKEANKEGTVSAEEFAKSIAKDYDIDDVDALVDMLNELSKSEYDLSLKAFLAAQQATNFHEAIDAVRDAVGTKMMKMLTYFIGDLDQARKLWTDFSNSLWDIFAGPLDATLDGLEAWNKGILETEDGVEELEYTYEVFWESVGRIFTSLGEIFGGFLESIKISLGLVEEGEDGAIKTVGIIETYTLSFLTKVTKGVSKLADILDKFLESEFYENIVKTVTNIFMSLVRIKNIITKFFGRIILTILKNLSGPLTDLAGFFSNLTERFANFLEKISESKRFNALIQSVTKLTAKLMTLATKVFSLILSLLTKILDKTGGIAGKLIDKLLPVIDWIIDAIDKYLIPALDYLIDGPYSIGDAIDWLKDKFLGAKDAVEQFSMNVFGLSFDDAKEKLGSFVDFITGKFSEMKSGVFDIFKQYFVDSFDPNTEGSVSKLFEDLSEANSVAEGAQTAIKWSGDAIMRPLNLVIDLLEVITGRDLSGLAEGLGKFIHAITDTIADISPEIFSVLEMLFGLFTKVLSVIVDLFKNIVKYLSKATDTTGFTVLDMVIDGIGKLLSKTFEVLGDILTGTIKLIPYITPKIKKVISFMGEVIMMIVDEVKDMFKTFSGMKDPDKLFSYLFTLLKYTVIILLVAKLSEFIGNLIFTMGVFSRGVRTFKKSAELVADSASGLLDTLGGYSFQGMIMMIALFLFSVGYALKNVVIAGEALSNEDTKQGIITAFAALVVLIFVLVFCVKRLSKAQEKGYKELEKALAAKEKAKKNLLKLQKKHGKNAGMWYLSDKDKAALGVDTKSMQKEKDSLVNSYKGIAQMLIGLGVALIGISAAIGILAKVSKSTSTSDMENAVFAIIAILLFIGIFLRLARGQRDDEKVVDDDGVASIKKKGTTYQGVATALIAFAGAMLLLTIPIALLAIVSKHAGKENLKMAVIAMAVILGFVGATMVLLARFNNLGIKNTLMLILTIKAVRKAILAIAVAFIALVVAVKYLDPKAYNTVVEVLYAFIGFFGIFSVVMTAWIILLSRNDQKKLKTGGLIKMVAAMSLFIIAVSISLSLMAKQINKGKASDFVIALGIIAIIIVGLIFVIKKMSAMSKEMRKGVVAAAAFMAATAVVGVIAISVMALALTIRSIRAVDSGIVGDLIMSVVIIGAIIGMIYLFIKGMMKMVNGRGSGFKPAKLLSLVAVLALAVNMMVIITALVAGLAFVISIVSPESMRAAILSIGVMMLLVGAMILFMAFISKTLAGRDTGGMKGFAKVATSIFSVALALSVLSGVLIGLALAMKVLGKDSIITGLKAVAMMLVVLAGAVLLFAIIGKVGSVGISAVAKVLLTLALVMIGMVLAVAVFTLAGNKLVKWLDKYGTNLREDFRKIGVAAGDILIGLMSGINENLPLLLEELGIAIATILTWLEDNIGWMAERLVAILAELLVGIGKGIEENHEKIADGLYQIILGIWHVIEELIGRFSDKFYECLIKWFGDPQEELQDEMARKEAKHQYELYEIRREGAIMYQNLLDEMKQWVADAYEEMDRVAEQYGVAGSGITTEDIIRAQRNVTYAEQQFEEKKQRAKDKYDVDWDDDSYVSKYLQGYDKNFDYTKSAYKDGRKLGESYGTGYVDGMIDSVESGTDTHSPSGWWEWLGTMFKSGLENGMDAEGTGGGIASNLIEAVKSKISGFTSVGSSTDLLSMFGMNEDSGSSEGSILGINFADSFMSSMSSEGNSDFMSGWGTAMNYDDMMEVPDINDLYQNGDGFAYEADLQTNLTDNQLNQVSGAVTTSNDGIVEQIKILNQKMDEYTEALTQIKMYMDTEALVGELVVPMDKALGTRANLKEKRGV